MKKEKYIEPTIQEITTFRNLFGYSLNSLIKKEYTCFNGIVDVRQYKVTAEIIDEPIEDITARIQDLWDKCDNHHHWRPLQAEAAKYGYTIKGNSGSKIKRSLTKS